MEKEPILQKIRHAVLLARTHEQTHTIRWRKQCVRVIPIFLDIFFRRLFAQRSLDVYILCGLKRTVEHSKNGSRNKNVYWIDMILSLRYF